MPPNIHQIANTLIRGEKAITFPLKYNLGTVFDAKGNSVLHIRGWELLEYQEGQDPGAFQDSIGDWVVEVLNEAYSKEV